MEFEEVEGSRFIEEVDALMKTAFPVDEQVDTSKLIEISRDPKLTFAAFIDNGEFVGLGQWASDKSMGISNVMYLAVAEEKRSSGYGSKILKTIVKECDTPTTVLEVESTKVECPNLEQRLSRKSFYQRNDFHEANFSVIYDGVVYDVLYRGEKISQPKYLDFMEKTWPSGMFDTELFEG
ncbi:MAG: GNAT family N-acetyltransferase [Coriobacteriales bacterium]|jgi:ribosomal protein S18 acetylase RimI-like enzyme